MKVNTVQICAVPWLYGIRITPDDPADIYAIIDYSDDDPKVVKRYEGEKSEIFHWKDKMIWSGAP